MAVRVFVGDLFASPAQTLVNAVNCVGVMGKGIALEFKRRYPAMYAERSSASPSRLSYPRRYSPSGSVE